MDPGSEQWYYTQQGAQAGPVSADALKRLVEGGAVQAHDLAWRDGMADWVPIRDLPEFRPASSVAAGGTTAYPGTPVPAPGYAVPPGGVPAGPCPETWLWQSILATLCCCLPLGVVGIIFAAQVKSKWQVGDQAGAIEAARKAKTFFWWAFGLGLFLNLLAFAFQFVAAASGY